MSLETGVYVIKCASSGTVADLDNGNPSNGTKVQGWEELEGGGPYGYNQRWFVQPLDSGGYTFSNLASGTVMELANGSSRDGTRVQGWARILDRKSPEARNQEWYLTPLSDYSFRVTNKRSGTVLDLTGGSSSNGTPLQGWTAADESHAPNKNQHWYFYRHTKANEFDDEND